MKSGAFWAGMLTGAVVGAAIALIYAPKAGEETRGDVAEGVRKFRDAAMQKGRGLIRRGRGKAEQAMGRLDEEMGRAEEAGA